MKMYVANVGKMSLIAGKVTEYREGAGSATGRVVNIKITGKVWNKDKKVEEDKTLDVAFWNSDDGNKKLADRIKKCDIKLGTILTVLVIEKDDGKSASAINFKLSGCWHFAATDDQKELNVFVGPICSFEEHFENNNVKFCMPEKDFKSGETIWNEITAWNNDTAKLADRAKILKPKDDKKVKAVVVCGENRHYHDRNTFNCLRFDIISYAKDEK